MGAALLIAAASPATEPGAVVDDLLTRRLGFSSADLRALDAGSAAIKSLDTPAREELAHVEVVYVDASNERFLERFRDIERFERRPGIPRSGASGVLPGSRIWSR